ncbi:MAG: T9SS type A sorting domain-containing protein, partial [Hymenobacter sp.]
IPNNNFETWSSPYGVEAPSNWITTDDVYSYYFGVARGTYDLGAVSKSTDAHGGSYAVELTSTNATYNNSAVKIPGEIVLGARSGSYEYLGLPLGGVPYTARPTQMQFYYKFSGTAADSALALVYLTKTVDGKPSLVGIGGQYLSPAATYSAATVSIGYTDTTVPDSIHVIFASGYSQLLYKKPQQLPFLANITVGATLLVDDVSLLGAPLAVRADASLQSLLTVSPNPSTGGRFVISAPDKPELAAAPLQVMDALGRTVLKQAAQTAPSGQRELDLSSLSTGIYSLRLDSKQGTLVRQLTVK